MSVEVDDVWLYEKVLNYLKSHEQLLPPLSRESPHFVNGDRRLIAQWIYKLARLFKIGSEAQHLAVYLFDYFIADHQADNQGLYLIGAACFSLACKVSDVEINTPQPSKILKQAPLDNVIQSNLLKSTELLVLQHFDWSLLKPTAASFLEYYSSSCLAVELELISDGEYSNSLSKLYNKWITCFREIIIFNDEFHEFLPSKLASSIVVATRVSIGMEPNWPEFMIQLTGYMLSEISVVVYRLKKYLDTNIQREYESFPFVSNHHVITSTIINNTGLVYDTIPEQILHQNNPHICSAPLQNCSGINQSVLIPSTQNPSSLLPTSTFHKPASSGDVSSYDEHFCLIPHYHSNDPVLCKSLVNNKDQQYHSISSTSFLAPQFVQPIKQQYFNDALYCFKTNQFISVYSQPSPSNSINPTSSAVYANPQLTHCSTSYVDPSLGTPIYYSQSQYQPPQPEFYNHPPVNQCTSLLQEITSCHNTPSSQSLIDQSRTNSHSSSMYVLVPSTETYPNSNLYSNSMTFNVDTNSHKIVTDSHITNNHPANGIVVNVTSNPANSGMIYSPNYQSTNCYYSLNQSNHYK